MSHPRSELLRNQIRQLRGSHRPHVDVANGGAKTGDLRVVEPGWQYIFLARLQRSSLGAATLVSRPDLTSVISRREQNAVTGGLLINPVEVLVQVLAPQVHLFVVVVEGSDPPATQCIGDLLHIPPLLTGERECHIVRKLAWSAPRWFCHAATLPTVRMRNSLRSLNSGTLLKGSRD